MRVWLHMAHSTLEICNSVYAHHWRFLFDRHWTAYDECHVTHGVYMQHSFRYLAQTTWFNSDLLRTYLIKSLDWVLVWVWRMIILKTGPRFQMTSSNHMESLVIWCGLIFITHAPLFRGGADHVYESPLGDSCLVMNIHNPFMHCATSQYVFKPREVIMLTRAVTIVAA